MLDTLAIRFGNIAAEAGKLILACRGPGLGVRIKPDGSPVTDADSNAERLIRARLAETVPQVPVLGEETFDAGKIGPLPDQFILVDPLDGTRDFTAGSSEFTVNIALIDRGRPSIGCVYAPALNRLYIASQEAFTAELEPGQSIGASSGLRVIRTRPYRRAGLRAVASRSHLDAQTDRFLATLPVSERRAAGSSLKFCVIAEGDADVYPRLAPTMEWDTAAGHAVLTAAGGCVMGLDGAPLTYGKLNTGLRNPGFIAWGREPIAGSSTQALTTAP